MPRYQRQDDPRPSSGRVINLCGERFTVSYNEIVKCAQIIQARMLFGATREEAEIDARAWMLEHRRAKKWLRKRRKK